VNLATRQPVGVPLWLLNIVVLIATLVVTRFSLPFGSFVALEGGTTPHGVTKWLVVGYAMMFGPLIVGLLSAMGSLVFVSFGRRRDAFLAAAFPIFAISLGFLSVYAMR
jgi:hypothetical protein